MRFAKYIQGCPKKSVPCVNRNTPEISNLVKKKPDKFGNLPGDVH